jgi:hypothetical protein
MKSLLPTLKKTILLLTLAAVMVSAGSESAIAAKKKAAGPDPAAQAEEEVKKGLEPINTELTKFMIKVQSRSLLSPDEAGKLADLKFKLMDIMNQYPQSTSLAKPVYQAGMLFAEREEYNDAYELFSYLAQGFPTNPYGVKAKGQIQQLEKRFGASYFTVEAAATGTTQTPAAGTTPAPATAPAPAKK